MDGRDGHRALGTQAANRQLNALRKQATQRQSQCRQIREVLSQRELEFLLIEANNLRLRGERLSQLLRIYIDGVPLDLASELLPFHTRLRFGLLSHIHLHAAAQKKYSDTPDQAQSQAQGRSMSKMNLLGLIDNLRGTTDRNQEQDWLKTNLAKFTRMLQGQRDLETVSRLILKELAPLVQGQQGVFYLMDQGTDGQPVLKLLSSYAYRERKGLSNQFRLGEGLVGQCVLEKERILVTDVPAEYLSIGSGLGAAKPSNVVVIPVVFEGEVKAVIELASFYRFSEIHLAFLDQLTESIGIVLNTIAAGMRTEELLKQSTSLADELRSQQGELTESNKRLESQAKSLQASEDRLKMQQEELQRTNEELEERSRLLQIQNVEVERKNREIEQAKAALEERAQQLALSSKYKSEFLANMSHELRTPLNSLLILARMLQENGDGNLSAKQVEFAQTIHAAGSDLMSLINDILDLSKIEAGRMELELSEFDLPGLIENTMTLVRERAIRRGIALGRSIDERRGIGQ